MADTPPTLTDRLMARGEGLRTQQMADGGEVFRGDDATRALKALGARAMTVDESIVVGDDFDAARPEDAALYAHERHHQEHSGGAADGHGAHEAEEIAARAVEAMVFQRATHGPVAEAIAAPFSPGVSAPPPQPLGAVDAALASLLASGRPRQAIVNELADLVLADLERLDDQSRARGGP